MHLSASYSAVAAQCAKLVEEFGLLHLSAGDLLRAHMKSGTPDGNMVAEMIKQGQIVPSRVLTWLQTHFHLCMCTSTPPITCLVLCLSRLAAAYAEVARCHRAGRAIAGGTENEKGVWQLQVTISLLEEAMLKGGKQQVLIDGFPRNEENRGAFEAQVIYWAPRHSTAAMLSFMCVITIAIILIRAEAGSHYVSGENLIGWLQCASQTGIEPEFVLFFDCPGAVMEKRLLARQEGRTDDNIDTIRKRFKVLAKSSLLKACSCSDLSDTTSVVLASLSSGEHFGGVGEVRAGILAPCELLRRLECSCCRKLWS